ncbi:copper ion binding protein [Syntrophomonas erecta]
MVKKIIVQGMSCQHCQASIEQAVGQMTGVNQVTAHYNKGYVEVDFDEKQVSLNGIIDEINDLGFDVPPGQA